LICGARGTKLSKEVEMKNKHKGILTIVLLVVFFMGMGFGQALAAEQGKININTATVDQLTALKNIGLSYAQRIVDYRTENGPFQKPEDIMKVRGIGANTYEANKDIISCE
jgi:competence protein ComEA